MKDTFEKSSAPLSAPEQALKELGVPYEKKRDGKIIVPGTINLQWRRLTALPDLSSVIVKGGFYCQDNQLTSLKGAPHVVEGTFFCPRNKLASLDGCPAKFHQVISDFGIFYSPAEIPPKLFTAADPWPSYVPVTREAARQILTRDLPAETQAEISVDSSGYGSLSITGKDFHEERSFDLGNRTVNSGCVRIASEDRKGQGLGRLLMRNEIEFFRLCGARQFNIFASLGNGGYTWARLGFLPETAELVPGGSFRQELETRYNRLQPLLEEPEKCAGQEALKLRDPEDAWRIADLRLDLAPRLRDLFARAGAGDPAATATRDLLRRWDSTLEPRLKAGKALPLGNLLLSRTSWTGHFDLENAGQLRRAEAYVGGWQAGSPKI